MVTSFEERPGTWEVIVDADNGSILSVKDIAIYCGSECAATHQNDSKTLISTKHFKPKEAKSMLAVGAS